MTGEPPAKRLATMKNIKIGTHNGTFHCDEVLACFMLKQLSEFENAEIVRSRDPEVLKTCDVVVDVGGVFDSTKRRFDHHQREFTETMNSLDAKLPWITKLSSAGLVYFHFGHQIIAKVLKKSVSEDDVSAVFKKVYTNFIEEVDAIDNGISVSSEKPRYLISTNLSSRVSHLNPRWNDPSQDTEEGFKKALKLVGEEFLDRVNYYGKCWLPARSVVKDAMDKRKEIDNSGEIVLLEKGGCPWKEHLFALEEEFGIKPSIKYVLYEDQNGSWRVQCVPIDFGSFENRLSLMEEWRGIRDDNLSKLSGVEGCVFVHASGFIGGNKTREGALKMAQATLAKALKG